MYGFLVVTDNRSRLTASPKQRSPRYSHGWRDEVYEIVRDELADLS